MHRRGETRSRLWYLLLVLPFVALLYPPLYAHADPELFGFPFFYWYQLLWVPITAVLTWVVYTRTRSATPGPDEERPGSPLERDEEAPGR
jgi:Protein of unknown function (DUF3311)